MPTNVEMQIPFLPQRGISEDILGAIQLANVHDAQRRQLALQQQAQPSEIGQREAEARRLDAQTDLDKMTIQMRRELFGALTGSTPGGVAAPAAQPTPAAPSAAPSSGVTVVPSEGATSTQVPLNPKDFASGAEYLQAVAARSNQSAAPSPVVSAAQPAPVAENPSGLQGIIGQTINGLLKDPDLKPEDKRALMTSGRLAVVKALQDPATAMDSITTTYNDILRRRGEMARTINTEVLPDSHSSTGYSQVATHADGTEAWRHVAPPPIPKNLEEASAFQGSAAFNYQREPSDGNKAALDLATKIHGLAYQDRLDEATRTARATAQARGADYEAMIRTGENPITKEKLTINNAPPGALVNPTTGQPIPQDMISLYKPTQNERQTADTARQVLAINADLKAAIDKNPKLVGPLLGRESQAIQALGFSSQEASKFLDNIELDRSASTKMHTGRFSTPILEKMDRILKPGMSLSEFKGALDSLNDVAGRYANEDKLTTVYEFQQRQQFENQGPAGANPFVPGNFSPSNPFAQKPKQ